MCNCSNCVYAIQAHICIYHLYATRSENHPLAWAQKRTTPCTGMINDIAKAVYILKKIPHPKLKEKKKKKKKRFQVPSLF